MDVTNRFVLDFAELRAARPGARILDYGCGAGESGGGRAGRGLWRCSARMCSTAARRHGPKPSGPDDWVPSIHEMREGRLPFADGSFDLVINNQVMEHVEDLDAVLSEIHRVLKPGGALLSVFPSRDVFREGHIGIPFAHWFSKGSRLRFYYAWALRSTGLGHVERAGAHRRAVGGRQAALDRRPTHATVAGGDPHHVSSDISGASCGKQTTSAIACATRRALAPLARLLDVPGVAGGWPRALFRKLAFLVIVSRKEAA